MTVSEAGCHEGNKTVDGKLQDEIQNFANDSAEDRSAFEQSTNKNSQLESQLAQSHQKKNLMQQLQQQSQKMNAAQHNQQNYQ